MGCNDNDKIIKQMLEDKEQGQALQGRDLSITDAKGRQEKISHP